MRWRARKLYRIIACVVVLGVLGGCSDERTNEVASDRAMAPDETFSDFVTQESDSGRVQWKLTAPLANRFLKKKMVLLDTPRIGFFNDEGEQSTTLTSEQGEYSEDTNNMLAFGNVLVRTLDGDVLETDSLLWDSKKDKILSNSFVKITRGNDVITGYGLETDPDLKNIDIKNNVRARLTDESGEIIEQPGG